jgi:hypothetical protein
MRDKGESVMAENKGRNVGKGRESAPGQNTIRQFVNDAGETIEGTMNDFHNTLRDQGYRPVDDTGDGEDDEPEA